MLQLDALVDELAKLFLRWKREGDAGGGGGSK
jgi:hypothetical protein